MDNSYEEKLGTEKMLPLIFKMALPAVAAQFVNLLYSIVDRIYIGHIPNIGTDALAGIGITASVITLISAFAMIVIGGASIFAIELGKGNREKAKAILGNGFDLLLIFTVLITIFIYAYMQPLLRLIGASDNVIGYAKDYLSVYVVGTIFVQITIGLNNYINAQGRPIISMLSVVLGAIVNIVLDPIFIFVFDMGVKGAAIATVISQACSALWIFLFLTSKRTSLRLELKYMKPQIKIIGSIFALGISLFIMSSTESIVGFVLNGSLKKYGDIYISALTVLQSSMQIISVPMSGFGQGCMPVVSYNYGHGNKERVKHAFKIILPIMFFGNLVPILLMIIFPSTVARLFTSDMNLILTVKRVMPVFLAGMTIFGLQRACQNTFVALGQAKVSLFIALLRKIILLVPLALILPRFMGVMGIYSAEAIADGTAAICCMTIFTIKFPKILKKIEKN